MSAPTFGTLRASRQGHRIATEIRNPPMASPMPSEPARSPDEVLTRDYYREARLQAQSGAKPEIDVEELKADIIILGAFGLFFGVVIFLVCIFA